MFEIFLEVSVLIFVLNCIEKRPSFGRRLSVCVIYRGGKVLLNSIFSTKAVSTVVFHDCGLEQMSAWIL